MKRCALNLQMMAVAVSLHRRFRRPHGPSLLLAAAASLLTLACSLQAEDLPRLPESVPTKAPEGQLPRRAMFGAQLAPVTEDEQDRQKLEGDAGVVIEQVFAGTSAADAGFEAGDIILAVDGTEVTSVPVFLERMAEARPGDALRLDVVRDGVQSDKRVTLKEMPRETGDGYDVIYDAVNSSGARLRTIITRPKAEGRHPAVMLIQGGHTCFSVDNPVGRPTAITWIAHDLAGHGYVTMRVERRGCGDSEGGPTRDLDFDTELEGYKQALLALKQLSFVDADRVFLFGHSMGGIMAPLVAVELPVRGIAVYGTASETWFESVVGQRRRLASLDGTDPAEVNREILGQTRFWYALTVEKKMPREIREQTPGLPRQVWDQWVTDEEYVGGRHYTFHHQIADKNLSAAWSKVAATRLPVGEGAPEASTEPLHSRVLAIWGTSDWMSTRGQHTWIAEVVNRVKPGTGSFVALDSIDHFFLHTSTPEESYRYFKPVEGMPPTEFNRAIVDTLCAWLNEVAGRTQPADESSRSRSGFSTPG